MNKCSYSWNNNSCIAMDIIPTYGKIFQNITVTITLPGYKLPTLSPIYSISIPENGNAVIPITVISYDVLQFVIPPISSEMDITLQLYQLPSNGGVPIIIASVPFSIIDCPQRDICSFVGDNSSCLSSTTNGICGWCFEHDTCTFASECNSNFEWITNSTCPFINSIDPSSFFVFETPRMIIKGVFVNHTNLLASVGDAFVFPTYIDSETIVINRVPVYPYATSIPVKIYFGSVVITSQFNVNVNAVVGLTSGIIALIVILPIVFVLAIAAAIVAFIFLRKRDPYGFLKIDLKEPDYRKILLVSDKSESKDDLPDNLEEFENLFFSNNDRYLFRALISSIPATDADSAAKYITYVAFAKEMALEMVEESLENEINVLQQANTIFRGNSPACMMFKNYAKLIGLPYVFQTIAKYVKQLEAYDKMEKEQGKEKMDEDEVQMFDFDIELDETKITGDFEKESNAALLKLVCEKILLDILNSTTKMPKEFIDIFSLIKRSLNEKI